MHRPNPLPSPVRRPASHPFPLSTPGWRMQQNPRTLSRKPASRVMIVSGALAITCSGAASTSPPFSRSPSTTLMLPTSSMISVLIEPRRRQRSGDQQDGDPYSLGADSTINSIIVGFRTNKHHNCIFLINYPRSSEKI
jgi:hypothetical protein